MHIFSSVSFCKGLGLSAERRVVSMSSLRVSCFNDILSIAGKVLSTIWGFHSGMVRPVIDLDTKECSPTFILSTAMKDDRALCAVATVQYPTFLD